MKRRSKTRQFIKDIGTPLRLFKWYIRWEILPKSLRLSKMYKKFLGEVPDFKNPKKMTEKLQWIKINERNPLMTQCADKYSVRAYVKEKIGEEYLIPLVFESENIQDITADNLPEVPFIIKTNHDSSGGVMVRDKSKVDWGLLRQKFKRLLRYNYYYASGEWQYKYIERRVFAEKLLIDETGKTPNDIKIHCFNGVPYLLAVDIDRFGDHKRNVYFTNGERAPIEWFMPQSKDEWRPCNWDLMLELAQKLSKAFYYARIDFYEINNKVYFGEITFHPGGGFMKFHPKEWDLKLGQRLKLPID